MSFVLSLAKRWGLNAHDSAVKALVAFDPTTASEAEIDEREHQLDLVSKQFADALNDARNERIEADAIEKQYNQKLAAAEILQKKLEDPNLPNRSNVETSLGKLVSELETLAVDVEREKTEAVDAEKFASEIKVELEELANDLRGARQQLKEAQRSMERAEKEEDRAQRKAEKVTALSGIRKRDGKLNTALQAMQEKAAEHKKNADAASAKADALRPTSSTSEDPIIASALKESSGQPDLSTASISDRLAALKNHNNLAEVK